MSFIFEQLDQETREVMLDEFKNEQSSPSPYVGKNLSDHGQQVFAGLMIVAITSGDETTLAAALDHAELWNATEDYERNGVVHTRKINIRQAAERLANSEFNTWYVRGLARRGLSAGVLSCEVYRAAQPKWEPASCSVHEGAVYHLADVYAGHRAKYWPEPGMPLALSVPFGPGCHHTIRLRMK